MSSVATVNHPPANRKDASEVTCPLPPQTTLLPSLENWGVPLRGSAPSPQSVPCPGLRPGHPSTLDSWDSGQPVTSSQASDNECIWGALQR